MGEANRRYTEEQRFMYASPHIVRYGPQRPRGSQESSHLIRDSPTSSTSTGNHRDITPHAAARRVSLAGSLGFFDNLIGQSVHQLRREYTYNQGRENALERALHVLRAARRLPLGMKQRRNTVLKAAAEVNGAVTNLGTRNSQLRNALVEAAAQVPENDGWMAFKPDCVSPIRAFQLLKDTQVAGGKAAHYVRFTAGPWAGQTHSVAAMEELDKAGWATLLPVFVSYLELVNALLRMLDDHHVEAEGQHEVETQLAHLFSDYWTLNTFLTFKDFDDGAAGVLDSLPPGFELNPNQMQGVAIKTFISQRQYEQCRRLQREAKVRAAHLAESYERTDITLTGLINNPVCDESSIAILRNVEDLRMCNLQARALEVHVVHSLLFTILQPVQTAKFVSLIRQSVAHPIAFWTDWMRILHNSIVGSVNRESWLDWYTPYDSPELGPLEMLAAGLPPAQ